MTPAAGCGPTGYITDVNGDGFDDLLVMGAGGTLHRVLSKGDGTFTSSAQVVVTVAGAPASVPWTGSGVSRRCAASDFDGDRFGDLACLYSPAAGGSPRLGILHATRGQAMWPSDLPVPANISFDNVLMAVGDVDNSGTSDLILAVPDGSSSAAATSR